VQPRLQWRAGFDDQDVLEQGHTARP
jgi:hypothetical protein